MDTRETHQLLVLASGIDRRIVSDVMIAVWQDALADVRYEQAVAALTVHRRESTEYVIPAHLVAIIEREDGGELGRIQRAEDAAKARWLEQAGMTPDEFAERVGAVGFRLAVAEAEDARRAALTHGPRMRRITHLDGRPDVIETTEEG